MRTVDGFASLFTLQLDAAPTSAVTYVGMIGGVGFAGEIPDDSEKDIDDTGKQKQTLAGMLEDLTIYNPNTETLTVTLRWRDRVEDFAFVVHKVELETGQSARYFRETWERYDAEGTPLTAGEQVVSFDPDGGNLDAFSRLRVSNPTTLFDSKLLFGDTIMLWDESLTGSASSAHAEAATTLTMNAASDVAVRQTYMRFNYAPGKSQLVMMTGVLGAAATGCTRRVGPFKGDATATASASSGHDGLFFELAGSTLKVVVRKDGTDTAVAQSSWNIDTLDGNGPSGFTLDTSKANIFLFDYEWLGVGRVRFGVVIDGEIIYCHEVLHANSVTSVYMDTPNLPLRYEISQSGIPVGTPTLVHICSSVISEGGIPTTGILRVTESGALTSLSAGTKYPLLGLRVRSTRESAVIMPEAVSVMLSSAQDAYWTLTRNPTVGGTFTYSAVSLSAGERAIGAGATGTVSGGQDLVGGYIRRNQDASVLLPSTLWPGFAIDGTQDEFVLTITPLSGSVTAYGSITFREYT